MDKTTPSDIVAKVAKLRASAKDKTIPQDIRNQFLDKANELEKSMYKPSMAKGGAVAAKTAKAAKKPSKGAAVAIVIGMGKPAKPMMNKGGMAKGKC